MYNVLIVDDETIILSGIKFLIDWEKNGCCIQDTARNGQEALEKIRLFQPDIVLCDISMPVMDGISLLQIVNQEFPSIVFLMLTNLQEFNLAQNALRYQAVDYLLKNQLDASSLEESLKKAKTEYERRRSFVQEDKLHYFDAKKQRELLQGACLDLIFSPDSSTLQQSGSILSENHMLDGYSLLYLPLNFSSLPDYSRLTNEEKTKLIAWEKELVTKLADTLFGTKYLHINTGQNNCLTLFVWGHSQNWSECIRLFSAKLVSASENITQLTPAVCASPCFFGTKQLISCREAYFHCVEYFYLNENTEIPNLPIERPSFDALGLTGIGSQLEAELNSRNLTGCQLLLEKAIARLKNTVHQKSQAIWLCNELYRSTARVLETDEYSEGYAEIKSLMTRRQIIHWIQRLKSTLEDALREQSSFKSAPVEKARQYVLEHAEERISLQDVADKVNISAGYLSTLFKKQYNQSFISFINQIKVEHACSLIAEKKYLISEISYRLGFENAYYFTKVFRRYTGMTPSEWEKKNASK